MNPTIEYVDRGTDRLALHVYPDPGDGPAVLLFPAMGVVARYYRPFAELLHGHGFAVAVADLRGQGASTPPPSRASRHGYAELVADVAAVREALKSRLDGRPLLLAGHSLGGQIALIQLAVSGGSGVAGLVLITAAIPYWRGYGRPDRYLVLPAVTAMGLTSRVLGIWPGLGFGGRQARRVMTDWAATVHGRYRPVDGVDVEAALAELRMPVLTVTVATDRLVPASLVDFLVTKLRAAPVERAQITAAELGGPADHFTWVRSAGPIAARIRDFAADL
jgi:predicted alpha/beta hydrolase